MKTQSFVIIDNLHINLISDDNPMIAPGKECYFLFTNVDDIHRLMIGQGTIVDQQYLDGLNQQYIIRLDFVCENELIKKRFFYDKVFKLSQFSVNGGYTEGRYTNMRYGESESICKKMFFKIDAFFVRDNFDKINNLRKEYSKYIIDQLKSEIFDLEEILTS